MLSWIWACVGWGSFAIAFVLAARMGNIGYPTCAAYTIPVPVLNRVQWRFVRPLFVAGWGLVVFAVFLAAILGSLICFGISDAHAH